MNTDKKTPGSTINFHKGCGVVNLNTGDETQSNAAQGTSRATLNFIVEGAEAVEALLDNLEKHGLLQKATVVSPEIQASVAKADVASKPGAESAAESMDYNDPRFQPLIDELKKLIAAGHERLDFGFVVDQKHYSLSVISPESQTSEPEPEAESKPKTEFPAVATGLITPAEVKELRDAGVTVNVDVSVGLD